jgi:hypothetical protein
VRELQTQMNPKAEIEAAGIRSQWGRPRGLTFDSR